MLGALVFILGYPTWPYKLSYYYSTNGRLIDLLFHICLMIFIYIFISPIMVAINIKKITLTATRTRTHTRYTNIRNYMPTVQRPCCQTIYDRSIDPFVVGVKCNTWKWRTTRTYDNASLCRWKLRIPHIKGKGRVLDIALLHDEHVAQERFTVSEVAADWHELMIPQRIMWPSIARASEEMDPRCSMQTYHRPSQLH